jgi:acyl-CoA synthetase (AMP-forming)/AMP-acid ligase II
MSLGKKSSNWPDHLTWVVTDTKRSSQSTLPAIQTEPSDLAFLQFTSGSTSEPKGVMISHHNLADNLTKITTSLKADDDTIVVSWLPQYHDMGLIGSYLGILYCGGSGYYLSPLTFLQRPVMWIEAISKFRGTHIQAPNFAFKLTARKFDASRYTKDTLDLSTLKHIINAAEPVTEESIDAFNKAFGPFGLKEEVMFPTYGLAEHTVFVSSGGKQRLTVLKKSLEVDGIVVEVADDDGAGVAPIGGISKMIGCGIPSEQDVDVKIVSTETLEALTEDNVGEIWIHSDSKAGGYYMKPEISKSEFFAELDVEQGDNSDDTEKSYLRTGDLGFLHNNELFVCGRLKDLIIIGGRNYYPQDIEATAEAIDAKIRPGCSAAFTTDPISGGDEKVAIVLELRECPEEEVCYFLLHLIVYT